MNTGRSLLFSRNGVAWPNLSYAPIALAAMLTAVASVTARTAPGQPAVPDPRITPGRVIDGWTGLPIPCRCRYRNQTYKLGDVVCMNTHVGTVLTRCELFLNNTSWVPTREPCTTSALPIIRADARTAVAAP